MRLIRKRKKDRIIEEEMKNLSMKRVCLEVLKEDNREWTKKKKQAGAELGHNRIPSCQLGQC